MASSSATPANASITRGDGFSYRVSALAASAWHAHVVSEAGGQEHTNGSPQFFGAASPHLSTRLSPLKTAKAGSLLLSIILSKQLNWLIQKLNAVRDPCE